MPKPKIEQDEADDEFDEDYEDEEEADEDLEEVTELPPQTPAPIQKSRFKQLPKSNTTPQIQQPIKKVQESQEQKPILIPRCVSQEEMFNIINDKLDFLISKLSN